MLNVHEADFCEFTFVATRRNDSIAFAKEAALNKERNL